MKVLDLLETRRKNWEELDILCSRLEGLAKRKVEPGTVTRFAALYRSVCADLALADAYQLPPGTVQYLHRLVGRAHNQLYRSQTFNLATWGHQLLHEVPRRLFNDNYLRLAFCIFWGVFLMSMGLAYNNPEYAEKLIGKDQLMSIDMMYSKMEYNIDERREMAGFYILNNMSVGLKCFAFGLGFGVGGLYATCFNASIIGAVFGYMANSDNSQNFFDFVTAHGPFELTAIVLSAAAGMRLGFSIVFTRGLTRSASLRLAGIEAMPTMWAAIVMFFFAAMIEAFLSPAMVPFGVKSLVAVMSSGLLIFYFVGLGYSQETSEP